MNLVWRNGLIFSVRWVNMSLFIEQQKWTKNVCIDRVILATYKKKRKHWKRHHFPLDDEDDDDDDAIYSDRK